MHAEPSVALNPCDPHNLLAACMVKPPSVLAAYASFDGGASWQSGALPALSATSLFDVTVAFDGSWHGFICGGADSAVHVWRTNDGGRSFGSAVTALAAPFEDHPSMAADRWEESGGGNLYLVWAGGGKGAETLGFTRSTDGGGTFEPPRTLVQGLGSSSVGDPMVAAGRNGLVCAVYSTQITQPVPHEDAATFAVVSSTDAGLTFSEPVTLGQGTLQMALPNGVLPQSLPAVAASPSSDYVYVAWTTHTPGASHSDIVVAASPDRGRTWGAAVPATPADHVIYFQPQLAVNDDGRVGLSAFALAGGRVGLVLFLSPSGQPRFGPPEQVTSQSFDPSLAPSSKHGAWWIGDYQGLVAGPGAAFHPVWNDTRTGNLELFTAIVR